jgi:hypothetical protein
MLAIADAAGGEWPDRARRALVELCTGVAGEDQSLKVELLADIKAIFDEKDVDALASEDLVSALNAMQDRPWCEFNHGRKALTQRTLASLLKPFEVEPRGIRVEGKTPRGYRKSDLEDVWARYLTSEVQQVQQVNKDAGKTHFLEVQQRPSVADRKNEKSPVNMRVVADVALLKPKSEGAEHILDNSGDYASQEPGWDTATPDEYEALERAAIQEFEG